MKKIAKYTLTVGLVFMAAIAAAQINAPDAQYFHNTYLANPAMAGLEEGSRLNLEYRNQWSNVPGAPRTQSVTYDFNVNKVGLGLKLQNVKEAGLSIPTIQATYAYHLPIDASHQLHFGINLGVQKGSFDLQSMIGNPNDVEAVTYNDRKLVFDADFGVAYKIYRLNLEATFYNLKTQLKRDYNVNNGADYNLFYVAAGYSTKLSSWTMNTKLAYRGIHNYTNLVDLGVEFRTENDKLGFTGLYHTNKSTTWGISYRHESKWQFLGLYNTVASPIANYANGSFEIALQLFLNKNK